jgi:hypothetical protein
MNTRLVIAYVALVLIPIAPLFLAWRKALARRDFLVTSSVATVKLPLLIATASCVCFLLFFLFLKVDSSTTVIYQEPAFIMIVTAFGCSLAAAILPLFGRNPLRPWLAVSGAAVSVVWLYLWAMSAVV